MCVPGVKKAKSCQQPQQIPDQITGKICGPESLTTSDVGEPALLGLDENATPLRQSTQRFAARAPVLETKAQSVSLSVVDDLIAAISAPECLIEPAALLRLSEELIPRLTELGHLDAATRLLTHLASLYEASGNTEGALFSRGRAQFFSGEFVASVKTLRAIPASSRLAPTVEPLVREILGLKQRQERLEQVGPHIAALEQIRLRVTEQLQFEKSEIHATWWQSERGVENDRAYQDHLIAKANRGIDEMIQALVSGRVDTVEAAFTEFQQFTSLPFRYSANGRLSGQSFRQNLLENSNVDVAGLVEFSKLTSGTERERWLLNYVDELRDNFGSLEGFPAQTVFVNLSALQKSSDPAIRKEAETLMREFKGEDAFTGLSDVTYAAYMREGAKAAVPMVLAMMVAGPVGAYAEGSVAGVELSLAGRTLWSGTNAAGKVGLLGRGLGFTVEATAFWGAHDAFHATMIGGGEYFTGSGLVRSYLMLGGLRVLMGGWHRLAGSHLLKAAEKSSKLALPLKAANAGGAFATEWAGFVGIGRIEALMGLVPHQERTLRQEIAQAGITLVQLKVAVAAGNHVTGHLVQIKTLEIKLDRMEMFFKDALAQGKLTKESFQEAAEHILGLQRMLAELQGLQPAYALPGLGPVQFEPKAEKTPPGVYMSERYGDESGKTRVGRLPRRAAREKTQVVRKKENSGRDYRDADPTVRIDVKELGHLDSTVRLDLVDIADTIKDVPMDPVSESSGDKKPDHKRINTDVVPRDGDIVATDGQILYRRPARVRESRDVRDAAEVRELRIEAERAVHDLTFLLTMLEVNTYRNHLGFQVHFETPQGHHSVNNLRDLIRVELFVDTAEVLKGVVTEFRHKGWEFEPEMSGGQRRLHVSLPDGRPNQTGTVTVIIDVSPAKADSSGTVNKFMDAMAPLARR